LRLWGLSYYTEPRLSIRVNTCGDGGGRSGKTDNSIPPFINEGGILSGGVRVAQPNIKWGGQQRFKGSVLTTAVV